MSILREYFTTETLIDRFKTEPEDAVDVLIPVMHTNELWKSNLLSIYREIPVNRLLIGDGGCVDNSLDIVREFPRVVIFDHSDLVSLGYSIRKLIESVETEWFIYLHSDVYLPEGWYNGMMNHQCEYDWLESSQHFTVLVDYPLDYTNVNRPYSGGQMGRKEVFEDILPVVEDDFLYRNEDIILAKLVERLGFRYGRVDGVFHYHQIMQKRSAWLRDIKSISLDIEKSHEEEVRSCMMQAKGLIKYLEPDPKLVKGVQANVILLLELDALDWNEFRQWVMRTNSVWWKHIRYAPFKRRLHAFLKTVYRLVFG
jgi:glycosyltransferase involved in cell wall biosynthesis